MPTTNNAGALRAWLRQCPTVERKRLFGADYLADNESYSLDVTPTALKYRENILGDMVLRETQEQNFVFASRDPYGAEFQQNLDNLGVMQDVSAWIIEQNNARNFPTWEGGEVTAIVPTLTAYPISMGSAFARYQMQIKVTYRVTTD
ncbi:MAG: hypothetical protein II008_18275 [Oscillospiraceae bacterium]|nr:hypothetical protein [Oscillospiraceae bacterium]